MYISISSFVTNCWCAEKELRPIIRHTWVNRNNTNYVAFKPQLMIKQLLLKNCTFHIVDECNKAMNRWITLLRLSFRNNSDNIIIFPFLSRCRYQFYLLSYVNVKEIVTLDRTDYYLFYFIITDGNNYACNTIIFSDCCKTCPIC